MFGWVNDIGRMLICKLLHHPFSQAYPCPIPLIPKTVPLVTLQSLRLRGPIKRQAAGRAHQHPVRDYFKHAVKKRTSWTTPGLSPTDAITALASACYSTRVWTCRRKL